jgi:hypothetical protein
MSKLNVNAIEPSTGTDITLGASGDTITVPSGATFTQSGTMNASAITAGTLAVARGGTGTTSYTAGITDASQWRFTTTATGDLSPIASNWEVNDTTGYGSLGSAMTESSGIFTFPSTGYWLITFICTWYINGSSMWLEANIKTTTNNSAYTAPSITYSHITQSEGDTTYANSTVQTIFDVTDTTQCKVQFGSVVNNDSTATYGNTGVNVTGVTFVRLGDT